MRLVRMPALAGHLATALLLFHTKARPTRAPRHQTQSQDRPDHTGKPAPALIPSPAFLSARASARIFTFGRLPEGVIRQEGGLRLQGRQCPVHPLLRPFQLFLPRHPGDGPFQAVGIFRGEPGDNPARDKRNGKKAEQHAAHRMAACGARSGAPWRISGRALQHEGNDGGGHKPFHDPDRQVDRLHHQQEGGERECGDMPENDRLQHDAEGPQLQCRQRRRS